jgi:hypothetical protein
MAPAGAAGPQGARGTVSRVPDTSCGPEARPSPAPPHTPMTLRSSLLSLCEAPLGSASAGAAHWASSERLPARLLACGAPSDMWQVGVLI